VSAAKAAATGYRRGGWCPIPIKRGSKQAALGKLAPYLERPATAEELRSWDWPGVGIVTGQVSDVLILDVDGPEGEAELQRHGHPPTAMVRTPSGGLHLYFKHPEQHVRTGIRVAPGLDVKAAGGYVVAPPSVGPNGKPYEWLVSPEDAGLADPPAWLLALLERERPKGPAGPVGERIPAGRRNKDLASLGGSMRRRGMGEAEILAALRVANEQRCEPPLEGLEVENIAASVARYEPAGNVVHISANGHDSPRPPAGFNLTDLGNAERFVTDHGQDLRYCYPWGVWIVWNGRRWLVDESGEIHRRAKQTVKGMYGDAAGLPDEEARKALAKHAMRSEAENRIQAMISLAKSEVPVMPQALDASPWLLNTKNGTIDLRTGEMREHRREDLITKIAPVEYDPDAAAPLWAATLERVLPSPELRGFFKKLCGYALSGDTSEHLLPVLYGTGANGKSTVLNTLLAIAGDYGMQAAPDLLVAKKGGHPTELADLFGMRLVASIEVEDGRKLAEGLVKQLTGGDRVKARRMRENFWEFEPTHTVFMAVNHKPLVKGTDLGIWRRIRLIPFTETIAPADQDKQLPEKLRAELPGILSWAIEGCLEWRRDGLTAPEEVRKATAGYRSEMDVIGDFMADRYFRGARLEVAKDELYKAYQVWCDDAGERSETKRKFGMLLIERGVEDGRNSDRTKRIWRGIGLSAVKARANHATTVEDVSGGETAIGTQESPEAPAAPGHKTGGMHISNKKTPLVEGNGKTVSEVSEVSEEQEARIAALMRKGFSEWAARSEVLAKDHPPGCECEVCL
jgi:putative DNA primase/helicase